MITAEDLVSVFAHHINPKIGWLRSADAKGADTAGIQEQLQKSFYDAAEEFLTKHPELSLPRPITSADDLIALPDRSVVVEQSGYVWTRTGHRWHSVWSTGLTPEILFGRGDGLTLVHVGQKEAV